MKNNQFDCIIIGGGLGGLTAGATLTKLGKKVLLLEQHYIAGGCATTFKRKDFVMEVGLHEMDGLHESDSKVNIFKFLEVDKNVDFIQIPELFRYKSENIDFIHPHYKKETLEALINKFPEDEKGIRNFIDFIENIKAEVVKFPLKKWKRKLIYPIIPLRFPNIFKASKTTIGKWLDENISNEELKLIITANLVYYHDDPYTLSMIYFASAQSSYIGGGGHFIKGGSQKLSDYLKSSIEKGGGQVLLGKKVTNIIIENKKAVGVTYKDSFNDNIPPISIYSNKIIANSAIPLVKSLLPKNERNILGKRIDHLKSACSLISIYIGFKKEIKSIGCKNYSTFIFGNDINNIKDLKKNNQGSWENRGFVFVDYGQIDSKLAPKGKSVGAICAADYIKDWEELNEEDYLNKKKEIAEILISRLEKVIPGIKEQIEYYEVGTPKTIKNYTLNPKGSPYGYAQTLDQSGMNRVPLNSPIKNLYFAGAWSTPGGGFTGAIISGFLCGKMVDKSICKTVEKALISKDNRIVKFISRKNIANNTIEVSMEKPEKFKYKAGQYAILEILNPKYKGIDTTFRSLSFVSHPNDNELKFTMRLSDSCFKKNINEMNTDDYFRVYGPIGNLTPPIKKRKNIVFLIAGIGITPILPFLKELENSNFDKSSFLFYSNKTEEDASYHSYIKNITLKKFNYIPIFTNTQDKININLLEERLKKLDEYDYYLVGTNDFTKDMKEILLSRNVSLKNINMDNFG